MKPSARKPADTATGSADTHSHAAPRPTAPPKSHQAPFIDASISIVVLLGVIVLGAAIRHYYSVPAPYVPSRSWHAPIASDEATPPSDGVIERNKGRLIDPNTAPWWELAAIPGIGEITAKRIVEHREAAAQKAAKPVIAGDEPNAVYRKAADLQAVYSIGQARAESMAPYLRFPKNDPIR